MASLSFLLDHTPELEHIVDKQQLNESDCELSDRSRPHSPATQQLEAKQQRNTMKEQQNKLQTLQRYAQRFAELSQLIERELAELEQHPQAQEEEEGDRERKEQRQKELRMLQAEISRTHKIISTVSSEAEITEEVFSSIQRQVADVFLDTKGFPSLVSSPRPTAYGTKNAISKTPSLPPVSRVTDLQAAWQASPSISPPASPSAPFQTQHPIHHPSLPQPFPSSPAYPSLSGWGSSYPYMLPPPLATARPVNFPSVPRPQHPFNLPPLVHTSAQAAYFQLKDPKSEQHPLPSIRERMNEQNTNKVNSDNKGSSATEELESGVVHLAVRSASSHNSRQPSPQTKKEESDCFDKLSYLVHSASELSEEMESSPRQLAPSTPKQSITPNSEEGAQLLLSKLAEICQERAVSEGRTSDSSDDEKSEKKRKRSSSKNKNKKKKESKEKKTKKRKTNEENESNDSCGLLSPPAERSTTANGGKERKSPRRTKTPEQLDILEREYSISIFPSTAKRLTISKLTGLTPRGVQIWFQNKRAKDKANKKVSRCDLPHGVLSPPSIISPPVSTPVPSSFPFSSHPLHPAQSPQTHPPVASAFSPQLPPFVSSSSTLSPIPGKPILPPPSVLMSSYPSYHQPQPAYPSQSAPKDKIEIWKGSLSWHEPKAETSSGPCISTANLIAQAHEWSEPSHYVRECPKQLIVAGFAAYEQYEHAFRRAHSNNAIIDFHPATDSQLFHDNLIRALGDMSKCALVYLGNKSLLLASTRGNLFGCLCSDISFGAAW